MNPVNSQDPSITIYRGFRLPNQYVWSPFVTKLEARLRFSNLLYRIDVGGPRSGPRGKIPYVDVTTRKGHKDTLSDTTLITSKLVEREIITDLNAALTPANRAHDLALRALLEDKLVFYHTYERWHLNYYIMRDHVMGSIPYPIRVVVGMLAYRANMQTLQGQGTGRFTYEEMATFRLQIWTSIDDLLMEAKQKQSARLKKQKAPFWVLGGESPSEADCTLFGFIVSVFMCTAAPDSRKLVWSLVSVIEYAQRIHDRYFPDYQQWEQ